VSFTIEPWADQDRWTDQDVIELWTGERVLPLEEARRRVAELTVVATAEDGTLGGVSTAYLARQPQLGMDLWHSRAFVAPAHRRTHVGTEMTIGARDLLRGRWDAGDRSAAGIVLEVEYRPLFVAYPEAHWWWIDFVYVGHTAAGARIFVHYFPGAVAPPPGQGTT
jgi:hypothetical protein